MTEIEWQSPETAPKDGSWIWAKLEGHDCGLPVCYDVYSWDEGAICRRDGDRYEYEGAFRKFRRPLCESRWDCVVGWTPHPFLSS